VAEAVEHRKLQPLQLRACQLDRASSPRKWYGKWYESYLEHVMFNVTALLPLEPPDGFEPSTCSLRVSCSTSELGWLGRTTFGHAARTRPVTPEGGGT
jgi:hypothetical protein